MKPKIITIVGKSNSGKTTLLAKIVASLTKKGYRIGSVKHTHCGFDVDKEGKDSWRHRKAGASATLVVTDDQAVVIKDDNREPVEKIAAYLSDMDIIIAEGFKSQNFPKIEVFRKESNHKAPLFMDNTLPVSTTLIAFVTNSEYKTNVPVYGLEDIEAIANFIETTFLENNDNGKL